MYARSGSILQLTNVAEIVEVIISLNIYFWTTSDH